MAKKVDLKKACRVGIVWTILYFSVVIYYVYKDLGINLLSLQDLQSKYFAFSNGQWVLNSGKTILLISVLFLFFPVWIFGGMTFYRLNWRMPRLFKKKEKDFKRELLNSTKESKSHIPVKLRPTSGYTHLSAQTTLPVNMPILDTNTVIPVEEQEPIPGYEELVQLARHYMTDIFENIDLGKMTVPLAVSKKDEDLAVLITIISKEDDHFSVNIADGIEGDWYTTQEPVASPAAFIKKAADQLREMEPSSIVMPTIIISDGQLEDAEDVQHFLTENGITLLRFKNGGPKTLMSAEEFFEHFFEKEAHD